MIRKFLLMRLLAAIIFLSSTIATASNTISWAVSKAQFMGDYCGMLTVDDIIIEPNGLLSIELDKLPPLTGELTSKNCIIKIPYASPPNKITGQVLLEGEHEITTSRQALFSLSVSNAGTVAEAGAFTSYAGSVESFKWQQPFELSSSNEEALLKIVFSITVIPAYANQEGSSDEVLRRCITTKSECKQDVLPSSVSPLLLAIKINDDTEN